MFPNEEIDITKGDNIHDRALKNNNDVSIAHNNQEVREEQNIYIEPKPFKPYLRNKLANDAQDAAYEDMVGGNNPVENIGVLGQNDSYYDQYIQSREDLEDLNEVRAREQGFISKIGGGLGKFAIITAAGTVGNIVGTLAGIVEGIDNVIEGDAKEGNGWDRFWTGFWFNKVNTYMNDIIKSAEEAMPVYESKAYQNAGFLDRVLSANFLSGFIANMGWTSSAILSTVLTGGMGAASLGSSIARSLGASKNAANWVYRLVGACTGSLAEASTEAINNYDEAKQDYYNLVSNDYKNQKAALDAEMQQYYQSEIERLGLQQKPEQEPIRVNGLTAQEALWKDIQNEYAAKYAQLESDYERKLATIEDNATKAGTNTFGANVFWLTLSNSMGVFSNISTPMSNINRVARGSWKNIFKAAGQKEGISRSELLAREVLEAISQGNEEMVQKGAAETAKAYYGQYYNPEFTGQMRDYFDIAGEQYANVYKDPRAWEEFASGMFLGISGAAGAGHKSRKTEDGKVKQGVGFEWTGGLFNAIKESKEVSERSKQIYDNANKIYNDFSKDKNLQARARMVIGILADKDEMAKAVDNADKKAFLDREGEQLIRIFETFSDIGRMNDLKAMVGQNTDMTDDEIKEFALINSEEIKDENGKSTGRYKSSLPVVDANGELLSDTKEGREKIRERLKKDQEKTNKLINTYQDAIESTDRESGYSLSRDQLKVLTWSKMKHLLSEDRKNEIAKEKINKKISLKSLYEAFLNNRTYSDKEKDKYIESLESEAAKLNEVIDRLNTLENGFTEESDKQNKKILESDLKKINMILSSLKNEKNSQIKEDINERKEEADDKEKKSEEEVLKLLGQLDETPNGTILASMLGQKIGEKTIGDKKEGVYFIDVLKNILEEQYGDEASEIIDNLNDLVRLHADSIAYDKMFREFIGAPHKIDDFLKEARKISENANIKYIANEINKKLNKENADIANILENELSKESDENRAKIEEILKNKNTDVYKYLKNKQFKESLSNIIDDFIKTQEEQGNGEMIASAQIAKDVIVNEERIDVLLKNPIDWYREIISKGYPEELAMGSYAILKDLVNSLRSLEFNIATKADKIIEEAKNKGKGVNTNTGEKVEEIKSDTKNITSELSKYLESFGYEDYIGSNLAKYGSKYLTGKIKFDDTKKDDIKYITDIFNVAQILRAVSLIDDNNKDVNEKASETLFSGLEKTKIGKNFPYILSRYKITEDINSLKTLFPNSNITIIESEKFPEETALITKVEAVDENGEIKYNVEVHVKKQKNSEKTKKDEKTTVTPTEPIANDNQQEKQKGENFEKIESEAKINSTINKLNDIVNNLNKQIFLDEEKHIYYIYQGDDVSKARETWNNVKSKINKENAKELGFTYNDISASGLYYDFINKLKDKTTNNINLDVANKLGTEIDFVCREFFVNKTKEEVQNSKEINLLYDKEGKIDLVSKIFDILNDVKNSIKEKHGENCRFITDPINLIAQYNTKYKNRILDRILVGVPDLLVIDKNGVIHVYDFKAKKTNKLISKENPNTSPIDNSINDYDAYATQTFSYAKMLKELGLNVSMENTFLIQFNTEKGVEKTGIAKLDRNNIVNDVINNIQFLDLDKMRENKQNEKLSKKDIEKEVKEKEKAEKERKEKEESEQKEREKQERERKEKEEKINSETIENIKKENKDVVENGLKEQELSDIDNSLDKEIKKPEQSSLDDNFVTPQYAFKFSDVLEYSEKKEKEGIYYKLKNKQSKYLEQQGAFEFLNNGSAARKKTVYFKDITYELAEFSMQLPEGEGFNKLLTNPTIGIFVKDDNGKMQIVGALNYDSGSIDANNTSGEKDGIGDTSRSFRNAISRLIIPDDYFTDRNEEIEFNGERIKRIMLYNRNYMANKGGRRSGNTTKTGIVNSENGVLEVNIEAKVKERVEVGGKEYISIENADGQPLQMKIATGRVQQIERDEKGNRVFRSITNTKCGNLSFDNAFNNNKIFIGVIVDGKIKAINHNGELYEVDINLPNGFKDGANVVVYKGGDGKLRTSLIFGKNISKEAVYSSDNYIEKRLKNSIYSEVENKDGSTKNVGLASVITKNAITRLYMKMPEDGLIELEKDINSSLYNIFNNTNIRFEKNSAKFDVDTNILSFKLNGRDITLNIGSIEDFDKDAKKYSKHIENNIYELIESLDGKYSIRLPQFIKNESNRNIGNLSSSDEENAKEYINSMKDLMVSTIDNFSTRNTRVALVYDYKANITKVSVEEATFEKIKFKEFDIVKDGDNDLFYVEKDGERESNEKVLDYLGYTQDYNVPKEILLKNLNTILSGLVRIANKYSTFSNKLTDEGFGIKDGKWNLLLNKETNEYIVFDLLTQKLSKTIIPIAKITNKEENKKPASTNTGKFTRSKRTRTNTDVPSRNRIGNKNNGRKRYKKGVRNIHELLNNSNTSIAKLLKSVIRETSTLEVLSDEEYDSRFGDSLGVYKNGNVYIRESSTESTLIHELCHYVVPTLLQNQEAGEKIKELRNQFKEFLEIYPEYKDLLSEDGVSVEYSTINSYEFLSEIFSNKKTIEVLKKIPADFFVFNEEQGKYLVNTKYANNDYSINESKVGESSIIDNLFNRLIKSIIDFFKSKFSKKTTTLFDIAEKAGEELIKSFNNEDIGKNVDRFQVELKNDDISYKEQQELQSIKEKAIADGTFMKAPNGKPTNLTERQWLQVRTKAFKKWFGDWEKAARKNSITVQPGETIKIGNTNYTVTKTEDATPLYSKNGLLTSRNIPIIYVKESLGFRTGGYIPSIDAIVLSEINSDAKTLKHELVHGIEHGIESSTLNPLYEKVKNNISEDSFDNVVSNNFRKNIHEFIADAVSSDVFRRALEKEGLLNEVDAAINSLLDNNNTSKVVDENGEPLVVYHTVSTDNDPSFTIFDTNKEGREAFIYTTDNLDMSKSYAYDAKNRDTGKINKKWDTNRAKQQIEKDKNEIQRVNKFIDRWEKSNNWSEYFGKNVDESDYRNFSTAKEDGIRTAQKEIDEYKNEIDYLKELLKHPEKMEYTKPLFVNIKRPLIIEGEGNWWNELNLHNGIEGVRQAKYMDDKSKYKKEVTDDYIVEHYGQNAYDSVYEYNVAEIDDYLTKEDYKKIEEIVNSKYPNNYTFESTRTIEDSIRKNSDYDGMIVYNVLDYGGGALFGKLDTGSVFAAKESNQVKSATDNVGTFSRENNDIRYRERYNQTNTKISEFKKDVDTVIDSTKINSKITVKQYINRINEAGLLSTAFDKASKINVNDTNRTIKELFEEILPTILQKDITEEELDDYIEKYFDAKYGYDTSFKNQALLDTVYVLRDFTIKFPLMRNMLDLSEGNKNFGISRINSIFTPRIDKEINYCKF